MSNLKFKLNRSGVRQLLRSEEMAAGLESMAASIAGRCGVGYGFDRQLMPTRAIASVYTDDRASAKDNLENNTILRNLK